MFATNQMPDKPTHKRTEDGAVMIVMRMIIRIWTMIMKMKRLMIIYLKTGEAR